MAKIVTFAILCVSIVYATPGDRNDKRILGGQDARPGQFPHQVSLQDRNGHFCGGSIIGPRKILTAAHCVYQRNIQSYVVVAGIDNLRQTGQAIRVARAVYHGNFDSGLLTNDVALVFLSASLTYNRLVQPIALADRDIAPGVVLTLSGWGYTAWPNIIRPEQLQTINLLSYARQSCANDLRNDRKPVTTGNICTTSPKGRGACHGDSGGPLISGNVQVGIVSWGISCAQGLPDVFTSVAAYRVFIDRTN